MKKYTFKTRHALLLSLLSLTTCFAMLLGTTFAWFTDSVDAGVNKIISGVLDVELKHRSMANGAFGSQENVSITTKLFGETATSHPLWEPEAMAVEAFEISNVGNLAFQYKFALTDVGHNTVSNTKSLLDVIKVAVVDGVVTDRDTLKAAATTTLANYIAGAGASGNLDAGAAAKTVTVALYWPQSDVDNDYNLKNGLKADDGDSKLYIDLGITLIATQYTKETDSFGDQYDAAAEYPTVAITASASAAVTGGVATTLTATNVSATVPAGTIVYSDTGSAVAIVVPTTLKLEVAPTVPASASVTVAGVANVDYYDISLLATNAAGTTEVKSTSNVIPVALNIGKNLSNVAVNHNGTDMTAGTDANQYSYSATDGVLTLYLNSFSPFAIGYDAPMIITGSGANPTNIPDNPPPIG